MAAKTTTVSLSANGQVQEFEFSHAERILRIPNTCWVLSDKEFEWKDNGLQRKRTTEKDSR